MFATVSVDASIDDQMTYIKTRDVYDLAWMCWLVIGANVISGVVFLFFGGSPKVRRRQIPQNQSVSMELSTIQVTKVMYMDTDSI